MPETSDLLGVQSRSVVDWVGFERVGSSVQVLQAYSWGVRPWRLLRRLAKL
jgi:hypothetical protein